MAEQLHVVDLETCLGDGICAEICPEDILEMVDEKATTVESRADACIECGQCVAVCPTESMAMPRLPAEDFERLPEQPFEYQAFFDFLRRRRSVRVFKETPVGRDVIQRILDAGATAPMGFPPHSTEVAVIDEREELDFLLEQLVKDYDFMVKGFSNPIMRTIRRTVLSGTPMLKLPFSSVAAEKVAPTTRICAETRGSLAVASMTRPVITRVCASASPPSANSSASAQKTSLLPMTCLLSTAALEGPQTVCEGWNKEPRPEHRPGGPSEKLHTRLPTTGTTIPSAHS